MPVAVIQMDAGWTMDAGLAMDQSAPLPPPAWLPPRPISKRPPRHGATPRGISMPPWWDAAPPWGIFTPPWGDAMPPWGIFTPPRWDAVPPWRIFTPPWGNAVPRRANPAQPADSSMFSANTIKFLIFPARWLAKGEWPPPGKTEQTILIYFERRQATANHANHANREKGIQMRSHISGVSRFNAGKSRSDGRK